MPHGLFEGEKDGRLLHCPFDPGHMMIKSRLTTHLPKCKSINSCRMAICPFNRTHRLPPSQMAAHYATCEERGLVDNYKYIVHSVGSASSVILPVENLEIESGENWLEEAHPTYDPEKRIATDASLLVMARGVAPAQRKEFREERRQLYQTEGLKQECEETGVEPFEVSPSTSNIKNESSDSAECGAEPFQPQMEPSLPSTPYAGTAKPVYVKQESYGRGAPVGATATQTSAAPSWVTGRVHNSPCHNARTQEYGTETFQPKMEPGTFGRGMDVKQEVYGRGSGASTSWATRRVDSFPRGCTRTRRGVAAMRGNPGRGSHQSQSSYRTDDQEFPPLGGGDRGIKRERDVPSEEMPKRSGWGGQTRK